MDITPMKAFLGRSVAHFSTVTVPMGAQWPYWRRSQVLQIRLGYLMVWQLGWMLASVFVGLVSEGLYRLFDWNEATVDAYALCFVLLPPLVALGRWRWAGATPGDQHITESHEYLDAAGKLVRDETFEPMPLIRAAIGLTLICSVVVAFPFVLWNTLLT